MTGEPANLLDRTIHAIEWYRSLDLACPNATTGTGAIRLLEARLREQLGASACFVLASCTSALLVALQLADVGPGAEVVVPDVDWHASRAAVRLLGGQIVHVPALTGHAPDDTASLDRATGPRTKAVVVTHASGDPFDLKVLVDSLDGNGISIIEDAARIAPLALAGRDPAASGRFTCFSFGPGKPLDAGEGGALVVRDACDVERALQYSQHPARQALFGMTPSVDAINHRIHPIAAVIALHALNAALAIPSNPTRSAVRAKPAR